MPDSGELAALNARMDALSQALARIVKRQQAVEESLAGIERILAGGSAAQKPEASAPAPPLVVAPDLVPLSSVPFTEVEAAQLATAHEELPVAREELPSQPALEGKFGLTVLNRIGVVTLILGIGFFFKWAVDNQWIGPAGRVELGLLAGFCALGIADFLWRRGQQTFAQGVTGTGAAILYLSIYAAFGFYKLIPASPAFVALVAVTLLTCAISLRYDSLAIAALSLFGAYLTPALLSTGENRPWTLFGYLLLLDIGVLALSRRKRWVPLELLAFSWTVIYYGGWSERFLRPDGLVPATVFLLVFWLVFTQASWIWLAVAAQALAVFAGGVIWSHVLDAYSLLEFVLVAGGMALAVRRRFTWLVSASFAAFWIAYWIAVFGRGQQLGPTALFWGFTGFFLLFLGWSTWFFVGKQGRGERQDLLLLAMNGVIYYGASYSLLHTRHHSWMGLLAVAVAAPYLSFGLALRNRPVRDQNTVLLSGAVALGFVTLAIPIQFSGYTITMAWAVESAVLAWVGQRTAAFWPIRAAALGLCLVFLRLAAYDSGMYWQHSYPLLANARFLVFCVSGIAALACAYWSKPVRSLAVSEYAAGNGFLLWGLCLETAEWAWRTSRPENRLSVETVSISVLFALYAVALVVIGVSARSALNRIAGLVLLGAVIVKLYAFDVWQLNRIYLITAFVVLGALLLSTSFLYSQFRNLIQSWSRDEETPS